jgi:hypothetical protein
MSQPPHNPELKRAILEVVENQLRENNPPATRETLDRLMKEGFSRTKAMDLIACVLVCEMSDVVRNSEPFQEDRFVAELRALPRLPWDEEESSQGVTK